MSKDLITFSEEDKKVIMTQFFPQGTSNEQMKFCISVAKELGLNPITKEIWFIKRKSKVNNQWVEIVEPMTGRDSFLKIAHRSGQFAGIESDSRVEAVASLENGEWVEKKELVATCQVFRRDIEKPFIVSVNYSEYVQRSNAGDITKFWKEKPHTMLKKVAESQALKKAFNIHGIYDEAEIRESFDKGVDAIPRQGEYTDAEIENVPPITENELKTRLALKLRSASFNNQDVKDFAAMFELSGNLELIQELISNDEMMTEFIDKFNAKFENGETK